MYYVGAERDSNQRLMYAAGLAAALHAALILGIGFNSPDAIDYSPQIEVTLAQKPSERAPEEARHVAQSNQVGSGEQASEDRVTSAATVPLSLPTQALDSREPDQSKTPDSNSNPTLVTRSASARRVDDSREEQKPRATELLGISPEVDQLTRELASLEATLDEQTQALSSRPRVKRLTSVSAREAVDAAYLHDWRQRVEAVGNKYYPEASLRYGIYGSLRLLVVIRYDGSLEDIRVLSSSGYAVLDDAAVKIVRMAAPFAPFPPELRETADKLEIIRTWQFQENELSSG